MLQALGGIVLGFLVAFITVMAGLVIIYLLMGPDRAFTPRSFDPSALWIMIGLCVSLLAAALGGLTCVTVTKAPHAPMVLAGLVLVLGLLMAVPVLLRPTAEAPPVRTGKLSRFDAMMQTRTPGWVALAIPAIGAFGVLAGSGMKLENGAGGG